MIDRRTLLAAMACLPLLPSAACAARKTGRAPDLRTRKVPGAGQEVPIVGIGTSRRYNDPKTPEELAALRDSVARFAALGGQMIDTAPSYGRAEAVVGGIVEELGIRNRLFLATKVGNSQMPGAEQMEQSFRNLRTDRIDLIAVHNLSDTANNLARLRDMKAKGRVRSIGITTSTDDQYADFEAVMRREELDVIQVDYALDNRSAAERILPLAQEKNMAVMINLPFGRGRLFGTTQGRPLPDWAAEIGATTWAQFFLKYILSHPSRPIAIPGMAQVRYVEDNLGAARGRLPDASLRLRMEQYIGGL